MLILSAEFKRLLLTTLESDDPDVAAMGARVANVFKFQACLCNRRNRNQYHANTFGLNPSWACVSAAQIL